MSSNDTQTDRRTDTRAINEAIEAGERTELVTSIKVTWSGKARSKIRGHCLDADNPRAELFVEATDRLKTRLVCQTAEEATAVLTLLQNYGPARSWLNPNQSRSLRRIESEIVDALEERRFEVQQSDRGIYSVKEKPLLADGGVQQPPSSAPAGDDENPYAPQNLGRQTVRTDSSAKGTYARLPLRTAVIRHLDVEEGDRVTADPDGDGVVLRPGDDGVLGEWNVCHHVQLGPAVVDALGAQVGDDVVAEKDDDHVRLEAETEIVDDDIIVADGGIAWADLHAFERDCLEAIRRLDRDGETVYGLAIKEELERVYGEEVNHGRLYPNLDDLVEYGLIEKGELDRRTNEYELTSAAERMLEERARLLADACGMEQPVADGGADR